MVQAVLRIIDKVIDVPVYCLGDAWCWWGPVHRHRAIV